MKFAQLTGNKKAVATNLATISYNGLKKLPLFDAFQNPSEAFKRVLMAVRPLLVGSSLILVA